MSIPTGIDLDHFRPGDRAASRAALDLPADDPVIGIVATLRDWKGHHDLLRAVASLSPSPLGDEACPGNPLAGGRGERHPLLVIVGDGPQRTSLERLVAELGIDERVRFAGEQVDVVPWLNAFDVFCLPSYSNEGVPQALMQAMACGIAAVSSTTRWSRNGGRASIPFPAAVRSSCQQLYWRMSRNFQAT